MHLAKPLTILGLLASIASAVPHGLRTRQAQGAQTVVYWGQNGGGTVENNDLAAYCKSNSGIDVLVLSFLYQWGNGNNIPGGTIGQSCYISGSGEGQGCEALASAITTCQSAGVKIILSLGGAAGSYSLQSDAEAEAIGQNLWDSYGNSGGTSAPRPFGKAFVNGWDFDIEHNLGSSQYYPAMISKLRSNFASDPKNTYYITGAPQCPIPEPNMGVIIENAEFDYLFVQFYNNNNYSVPCALPFNGNAPFNYNNWTSFISTSKSSKAKLFIGVPASENAANGTPAGATYYITPDQLNSLVGEYKSKPGFGGIMMWSAGFSDSNVIDGCTYAQQASSILKSGKTCAGTGPAPPGTSTSTPPSSTPTTTSSSTTPPTATSTETVAHWGQVR
ncbi:Fungal cellulose binding domain protein [Aspergillus sclerotialis]|uniref:Fungal cellulose binding domain protein n=1 Tax=Aspergillus sclerotialis TaxID=2070753 RepID=A0A3A2ZNV8_9EURO|nr:Fungal cellulose binding domain protein [Aspergillus sclerotialis]